MKSLSLWPLVIVLAGCSSKQVVEVKTAVAPVAVTTATAAVRQVAADFEETGTFIAEESSQIAPVAPGRVIATPVDVGAHVNKGDIICELDPRDAQLRLDQARAQLQEATASVRQMQSRIGLLAKQCVRSRESAGGCGSPRQLRIRTGERAHGQRRRSALRRSGDNGRRFAKRSPARPHSAGNRRGAGECGQTTVRGRGQHRAPEF